MNAVFVTGATGAVGSAVVAALVERGERVVAGVPDPDLAQFPAAVDVRQFDFDAPPEVNRDALLGANRLFLLRPPAIADVRARLFPVIDLARNLKFRAVTFLSLQGVQFNRRTPHFEVESYLRKSRAPWTFLRPNFFMQNLVTTYADQIREADRLFVPAGRSRTAFIDARDVGKAAATILATPQPHIHRAYTLSGEESLTYRDVARVMSIELGRNIAYAQPSEKDYLDHLRLAGCPPDYIDVQRMIHRVVRLNVSARPNRSVRKLTGEPATRLAQFVRDYRSVWESTPKQARK